MQPQDAPIDPKLVFRVVLIFTVIGMLLSCAPASSTRYNRHLSASAEPSFVNNDALAEARRINDANASSGVLAGAVTDGSNDHR
jgi:hypothetical protein